MINIEKPEPPHDPETPNSVPPQRALPVATRPQRFGAAFIDGFLGFTLSMPILNHYGFFEAINNTTPLPAKVSMILVAYQLGIFFLLHGYSLYRYGQTLGKRLLGIAIVTMDDTKPSFSALVLNRYLPQWVAGLVPMIGPLLSLADVLYIFFNDQNRCVHDIIAGTKVVDLRSRAINPPSAKSNDFLA